MLQADRLRSAPRQDVTWVLLCGASVWKLQLGACCWCWLLLLQVLILWGASLLLVRWCYLVALITRVLLLFLVVCVLEDLHTLPVVGMLVLEDLETLAVISVFLL